MARVKKKNYKERLRLAECGT